MKKIKVYIFGFVLIISCNNSSDNLNKKDIPPKEPCENISLAYLPITTHGFDINNYNSVVIQTYIKNSNFDTIIKEYKIIIGDVEDKLRQERDIVLPESITTNTDLRIIFNDTLKYDVTEMKTKWEGRYAQSFVGYQCTLVSYKLNGEENGEGNIYIDEPRFNLYWEKQLKKL